jgi:hypothetical protein
VLLLQQFSTESTLFANTALHLQSFADDLMAETGLPLAGETPSVTSARVTASRAEQFANCWSLPLQPPFTAAVAAALSLATDSSGSNAAAVLGMVRDGVPLSAAVLHACSTVGLPLSDRATTAAAVAAVVAAVLLAAKGTKRTLQLLHQPGVKRERALQAVKRYLAKFKGQFGIADVSVPSLFEPQFIKSQREQSSSSSSHKQQQQHRGTSSEYPRKSSDAPGGPLASPYSADAASDGDTTDEDDGDIGQIDSQGPKSCVVRKAALARQLAPLESSLAAAQRYCHLISCMRGTSGYVLHM